MHRALLSLNARTNCLWRWTSTSHPSGAFASFFFHNAQWLSPYPLQRTCSRASTHVIPAPAPSTSLLAYRETEVLSPRHLLKLYAQLSKPHLSALAVLTAMSGVALSPIPTDVPILLSTAIGTALCAASANTFNQLQEVPFDAQMTRTRMRPLVRRAISPIHATGFALVTGAAGPTILWIMVNPTTALLGAVNVVLYAVAYTWMKRKSIANTWVGAVVGTIPPLMGLSACGGALIPSSSHPIQLFLPSFAPFVPVHLDVTTADNPLAAFAFFMLLFSWQFPHFNSVSYLIRGSYAQAGYRMLSVLSPSQNALVALRHAVLLVPICSVLVPLSGITTWTFALSSLIPNIICIAAARRFWQKGGEKRARLMFQHSLWYLPAILGLMMLHKQGIGWWEWLGLKSLGD